MTDVQRIARAYQPQLESADSGAARQGIKQEQIAEMADAVEAAELTLNRYNAIASASRNNPELREKIQELASEAD